MKGLENYVLNKGESLLEGFILTEILVIDLVIKSVAPLIRTTDFVTKVIISVRMRGVTTFSSLIIVYMLHFGLFSSVLFLKAAAE